MAMLRFNRKTEKGFNYTEYERKRIMEDTIMKDIEKSYKEGKICKYTEEQALCAQEGNGRRAINTLYYEGAFSVVYNILHMVYFVLTLVVLPMIYLNRESLSKIEPILGSFALIIVLAAICITDKLVHNNKFRRASWMHRLNQFTIDTSIFTYVLSSLGYMSIIMGKFGFWCIYIMMCLIFIISVYFDVIKPWYKDLNLGSV